MDKVDAWLEEWLEEFEAEKKARRRTDALVEVAITLVASGRATIAEAARLAGCSRQRLHEACRSYASFSASDPEAPPANFTDYDGTSSALRRRRRWGHVKAKPIDLLDMTAPRRDYLDRLWSRLVAGHDARDSTHETQDQ